MTDDTKPEPTPPGDRPPADHRTGRLFGGLAIVLFVAVGIGAFVLAQWDGNDRPATTNDPAGGTAATTTTVPTTTGAGVSTTAVGRPTTSATTTTSAEPPGVQLVENPDGTVTLRGNIPSAAVEERLLAAVESAYGEPNVIDETTLTGSGDEPPWIRALPRLIRNLNRVEGATLDASFSTAGTLVMEGTVADEGDRSLVIGRFQDGMPELTMEDRLRLASEDTDDGTPSGP